MQNRWNDADAAALDGLDLLVYASRLVGADTALVVWGGGNTSIKTVERDHRGREQRVLRVKGSGSDLKSIRRQDFPGVRMDDVLALLERDDMGDQEMVDYLRFALQKPGGSRPSIETLLQQMGCLGCSRGPQRRAFKRTWYQVGSHRRYWGDTGP